MSTNVKSAIHPIQRFSEVGLTSITVNRCKEKLSNEEQYLDFFVNVRFIKSNFKQSYNLELKNDAKPVTHAPRKFAISLLDQLKNELNKLEKMGIIKKWVNSMVVIKKPNNELRICLDPQDLNKNLKREHFPMATVMICSLSHTMILSHAHSKPK
ncbi:Reverse transcriptase domain-containing protein [Aphis craccivora]|uniref:Reverse transcriptase domain-containing protein n=1 Tax=Aphis craccivora TaxID=307492 RepID=A0A6G0X1K2_APHCR|nr:Reverse transcriptase domain-containing protein [Aphis craccivora]